MNCSESTLERRQPPSRFLKEHLMKNQYGRFKLTDAARPAYSLPVVPVEGYSYRRFCNPYMNYEKTTSICSAVSAERIFDTFRSLSNIFGRYVDVILQPRELLPVQRKNIESLVLFDVFTEHKDLVLDWGYLQIFVCSQKSPTRVCLTFCKGLDCLYGNSKYYRLCTRIFRHHNIPFMRSLSIISDKSHFLITTQRQECGLSALCNDLAAEPLC